MLSHFGIELRNAEHSYTKSAAVAPTLISPRPSHLWFGPVDMWPWWTPGSILNTIRRAVVLRRNIYGSKICSYLDDMCGTIPIGVKNRVFTQAFDILIVLAAENIRRLFRPNSHRVAFYWIK